MCGIALAFFWRVQLHPYTVVVVSLTVVKMFVLAPITGALIALEFYPAIIVPDVAILRSGLVRCCVGGLGAFVATLVSHIIIVNTSTPLLRRVFRWI
jgi:hypothetical protein